MEALQHAADSAWEAAQHVAINVIDGSMIHCEAPDSPDVSNELADSMPDLTGRLTLTLPWSRATSVNPEKHYVWILDNTAFRSDRFVISTT